MRFPHLRFRFGNATGSDQAFSEGVAAIDTGRLQIIAPYAAHRQNERYPTAHYDSPESLSVAEESEIAYKTIAATPQNKRLIDSRDGSGRLAAKAPYLIRDTMKVTGFSTGFSTDFPKPLCALFYADPADPMRGGTGHTIRVCQQENVPVVLQGSWQQWLQRLM